MSFLEILKDQLIIDEGYELKPYPDTAGKITIGVGVNLTDRGLPAHMIDELFEKDMENSYRDAEKLISNFSSLSDNRKAVLANMSFNLGYYRLKGFKKMIGAVERSEFNRAADEMLDSKWARQVKQRAIRLANHMRKG